jgi:P-type conjugative transfer protein TrbJ
VPAPQPVQAGLPIPATEITQLLNHAQLLMQYLRQAQQLLSEVNREKMMIQNLKQLNFQSFGNIVNDLGVLSNVVQGGQAIAYSMGNIDHLFRMTFPGYTGSRFDSVNQYFTKYAAWSQTSLDTTLGVLRASSMQGQQLQNEQALINALRQQASRTSGHLEALQVVGEMAEQQVEQLMKLRQLMIADISSKQAFQAAEIQDKVAERAASERFFSAPISILSDNRVFDPVR